MSNSRAGMVIAILMPCLVLPGLPASELLAAEASTSAGAAIIEKPVARTASGSDCRIVGDTFAASWGPAALPLLAFVVGPSPMADIIHADKRRFGGPGAYKNVEIVVQLGKTVSEDRHDDLGTVTVNADGRSGTFALNDGSAAGRWTCGTLRKLTPPR